MASEIKAISYYLPERTLTNAQLSQEYPEWTIDKIDSKTGIKQRHISMTNEYSLDLALKAAEKFFIEHGTDKNEIDFILFCSQTPKYLIAISACILQYNLGIPTSCGALDINLGCSGYVYSLAMADSLIKAGHANKILIITADTYSKLIGSDNRQLRTLFSDAATVSLVEKSEYSYGIQEFVFGSDGSGANKLISKTGGLSGLKENTSGYTPDLYMDGPEIFNFTLTKIPHLINQLLNKSNLILDDIDLFIFHQANRYMLEHLRKKMAIPEHKFYYYLENIGNTVSSSIPIALKHANKDGKLHKKSKIMLVGFGVGFSWGGVIIDW